jgi:predicted secreted protein
MQPSAARAASVRLGALSAGFWAVLLGSPAFAGDRALIDFVGFSEDFRYFAFEEFGVQDGSGFPYSNVYVVDLSTDSWVVGTPIRVQAESEEETLPAIRAEAATSAADYISEFGLAVPVETAALIGDGAPNTDARTLAFGAPGYQPGAVSGDYTLSLSSFETTAASPCADWFGAPPLGYELRIADAGGDRLVHRDDALPRSRGCPLDYRLYGVVMPYGGTTIGNAVAIVSVYPGGFEGPDRRFLAVPLGL